MADSYNRKDHLYRKAKDEGLRSRAAYKLVEINAKFKLIGSSCKLIDLGAWPGGWLQVALKSMGPNGLAVGIDLVEIEDLDDPRLKLIVGDVRDDHNIESALRISQGPFDVLLSDMSPKLTGIREVDQSATLGLAELCFSVAKKLLRAEGHLVCKVFKGGETDLFVKSLRPLFNKLVRTELDSSRNTSNESYLVGLGYKPGYL